MTKKVMSKNLNILRTKKALKMKSVFFITLIEVNKIIFLEGTSYTLIQNEAIHCIKAINKTHKKTPRVCTLPLIFNENIESIVCAFL